MPVHDTIARYSRILRGATLHDRPVYAHFGITHRCDTTCRMCGIWKYGNKDEEMSLAQIAQMADVLQELGVLQVSIGGGEPFVRSDLAEVIHIFKQRGLPTRVLTNGLNQTESRIRELVDAGLEAVSVSFDTLSKKRFAWICMDQKGWDKVVTNLVRFANLLPRRGNMLVMNSVASRENLAELPDLVHFSEALGYYISLLPIELADDALDQSNKFITHQPRMKLTDQDFALIDEVYDKLILAKSRGAPILSTTPYLMASRRYFKTGKFPPSCDAGSLYFSINPSGTMTLCHRGPEFKSMLDPDIVPYFRSRAFKRQARREVEACSGCIRPCWIDTSQMFKTPRGFLETAQLNIKTMYKRKTVRVEDALAWARA